MVMGVFSAILVASALPDAGEQDFADAGEQDFADAGEQTATEGVAERNSTGSDRSEAADIEDLDLAALLGTISSASRYEETVLTAPAAVTVFDAEEIRNSGAISVPDLLRLVPGVQVYQTAPGNFAVALRGSSSLSTNSLVVLLDGIPLGSPIDGSIDWSAIPIDVRDLERVEVVRGPVSTIYGANAYTGVINLSTRGDFSSARAAAFGGIDTAAKPIGGASGHYRRGSIGSMRWHLGADFRSDALASKFESGTQPPMLRGGGLGWIEIPLWKGAKLVVEAAGSLGSRSAVDHLVLEPNPQRNTVLLGSARVELGQWAFLDGIALWGRGLSVNIRGDSALYKGFSYAGATGTRWEAGFDLRAKLLNVLEVSVGASAQLSRVDAPFIHPYENAKSRPGYAFYVDLAANPHDRVRLTAAVRGDLVDVTGKLEFSYRASAIYSSASSAVRLSAASAFRSPSWVELGGKFSDPQTGLLVLEGSPSLLSPRIDSVEVGAFIQPMKRFTIAPTIYWARFSSLLIEDYAPVVRKSYVSDSSPQDALGAEFELKVRTAQSLTLLATAGVLAFIGVKPEKAAGLPAQNSVLTAGLRVQGAAIQERISYGLGITYASPRAYALRAGIPPAIFGTQVSHQVRADAALNVRPFQALPLAAFLKLQLNLPGNADSPYPNAGSFIAAGLVGIEYRQQ